MRRLRQKRKKMWTSEISVSNVSRLEARLDRVSLFLRSCDPSRCQDEATTVASTDPTTVDVSIEAVS